MIDTSDLEKAAAEAETLLKAHVKQYARKDGTVVKEHDDSRQAHAASSAANDHHSRMKFDDPKDMGQNAKLHHDAAMKHIAAWQKGRAAGDESAKEHYYRASHHLSVAHSSRTFQPGNEGPAAQEATKTAEHISKLANKHQVEHTAESLDVGSGMHLMAAEAHQRAHQALESAFFRNHNDTAARAGFEKQMQVHKDAAAEHGNKAREITGVTTKATDKARTLGEHAKTAEDHIAASRAHAEAAKVNYDSEGRAEHEKAAKWHAGQAKKAEKDIAGAKGKPDSGDKEKAAGGEKQGEKGEQKKDGKRTPAHEVLEQAGLKHSPGKGYKPEADPYQTHKGNVRHKEIHEKLKAAGYRYTQKGKDTHGVEGEKEWHAYDRSIRGVNDTITLRGEGTKITRATRYTGPQRD